MANHHEEHRMHDNSQKPVSARTRKEQVRFVMENATRTLTDSEVGRELHILGCIPDYHDGNHYRPAISSMVHSGELLELKADRECEVRGGRLRQVWLATRRDDLAIWDAHRLVNVDTQPTPSERLDRALRTLKTVQKYAHDLDPHDAIWAAADAAINYIEKTAPPVLRDGAA